MLRLDDDASLEEELKAARAWRDEHLGAWPELMAELSGPSFRSAGGGPAKKVEDDGENFALGYVSLTLPRIVHDVPRVMVAADDAGEAEIIAEELEIALNLWARRSGLRGELIRTATDMLTAWGVGLVTHEPADRRTIDSGGGGYTPRIYRLAPSSYFMDPAATDQSEARYQGHTYPVDHEDLVNLGREGDGWDLEAIDQLRPTEDATDAAFVADDKRDVPRRDQVLVTELWVPELEHPDAKDHHHGTIVTIGEAPSGLCRRIREDRPYHGPPEGPYVLWGVYRVAGDPYPLGPIMAAAGSIRELNEHMRWIARSARTYKRALIINSQRVKLGQDLAQKPDLFVLTSDGPVDQDAVQTVELGGITPQQIEWARMSRERLERLTGVNEVLRGNVTGNATATEVQTASSSSSLRIEWIKRQFLEACDSALRRVAWYMVTDRQVKVPLGIPGRKAFGGPRTYQGGRIDFSKIDLEIDGFSVERTDDALLQRRAIELLQIGIQLAQAKGQLPGVADWEGMAEDIGSMLNQPTLHERMRSPRQPGMAPGGAGMAPAAGAAPGGGAPAGPTTMPGLMQQAQARG